MQTGLSGAEMAAVAVVVDVILEEASRLPRTSWVRRALLRMRAPLASCLRRNLSEPTARQQRNPVGPSLS